jgi:hypothetical protein
MKIVSAVRGRQVGAPLRFFAARRAEFVRIKELPV